MKLQIKCLSSITPKVSNRGNRFDARCALYKIDMFSMFSKLEVMPLSVVPKSRPLFKNDLIARTRRFIDLFVCANFERVVFAGHGVSGDRTCRDAPHYLRSLRFCHPFSVESPPSIVQRNARKLTSWASLRCENSACGSQSTSKFLLKL
jgi:hypothetical protein